MWPDSLSTHIYYIQLYDALNYVLPSKRKACITKVKCKIYKEWSCLDFSFLLKESISHSFCFTPYVSSSSAVDFGHEVLFVSCMLLSSVSGFEPFQMHLCCHGCTCSLLRLSEIPDEGIFCVGWMKPVCATGLERFFFIYLSCTRLFFLLLSFLIDLRWERICCSSWLLFMLILFRAWADLPDCVYQGELWSCLFPASLSAWRLAAVTGTRGWAWFWDRWSRAQADMKYGQTYICHVCNSPFGEMIYMLLPSFGLESFMYNNRQTSLCWRYSDEWDGKNLITLAFSASFYQTMSHLSRRITWYESCITWKMAVFHFICSQLSLIGQWKEATHVNIIPVHHSSISPVRTCCGLTIFKLYLTWIPD